MRSIVKKDYLKRFTMVVQGTGSYFLNAPNTLGSGQYTMVVQEIGSYF